MTFVPGWSEPPKRAIAMGGILGWKDGRNMSDVHARLFQYGDTPVSMRLNLETEMRALKRMSNKASVNEEESLV